MSQITKRALASALKELLEHKPLNKITIADITEQCGVNRQTFYYHFQDIYALLEWIYTTDAQRLLEGKRDGDTWQQGFLQVLEYIRDNRALVRNTYHSVSRELLEGYLYRVTYQLMRDVVEERAAGTQVPEEDRAFLAHFYKYAFVGLTVEWMQGGMKEEPARLVSRVNTVICITAAEITRHLPAPVSRRAWNGNPPGWWVPAWPAWRPPASWCGTGR